MMSKPYSLKDVCVTIGNREIEPIKSFVFREPGESTEKQGLHMLIDINGNDYTFKSSWSTITVTKHEGDHHYDLLVLGEEYELIFPNDAY